MYTKCSTKLFVWLIFVVYMPYMTNAAFPSFTNLPGAAVTVDAATLDPVTDIIKTVAATDPDNGDQIWFFLYDNLADFSINSVTGAVTAVRTLLWAVGPVVTLDIGVFDSDDQANGNVVHSTLTINLDNYNTAPSITNMPGSAVTVLEDASVGFVVFPFIYDDAQQAVSQLFCDVTYLPTTGSDKFKMDQSQPNSGCGDLKLKASLDFENQPTYQVTIVVRDDYSSSPSYTLDVNVVNVNDAPVFGKSMYTATFAEESSGVTVAAGITATDQEGDPFSFSFNAANGSSRFSIVGADVRVDTPIDRDVLGTNIIYLTMYAIDGLLGTGTSQIKITITDINDSTPTFTKTSYAFTANQFTGAGNTIGAVAATDADEGDNGKFRFQQITVSSYINILTDGSVTTANDLSALTYGVSLEFEVVVIDLGTTALTGTTTIHVTYIQAATTTSSTTTTTTVSTDFFDETANVAMFSALMVVVGIIFLVALFFCMKLLATGSCCFEGRPEYDHDDRSPRRRVHPEDEYDYDYRSGRASVMELDDYPIPKRGHY